MSLYFDEFGGLPCGKDFISTEQIPFPWDKLTPAAGDIMQASLDGLLQNDLSQNSSTAHIMLTREGAEHTFSAVELDMINEYAEWRGKSIDDTLSIEKSYIGAAAPIPVMHNGIVNVLGAVTDDSDNTSYMTWIPGQINNAFFVEGTKTKTYTPEATSGIYFTDLAIIPTSGFYNEINTGIDKIAFKVNGEIVAPFASGSNNTGYAPTVDSKILTLINAENHVVFYGAEYDASGKLYRYSITPIQKFSWQSNGIRRKLIERWGYMASQPRGTWGYAGDGDTGIWPLDIDCMIDGPTINNTFIGIGIQSVFKARHGITDKTWNEFGSVKSESWTVKLYKDMLCEIYYK